MSKVRELREKIGISQGRLAEMIGTTQSQITRIETGSRKMTKKWAVLIAPVLGVDPAELMFDDVAPGREPRLYSNAPNIGYVKIRGEVMAGTWHEVVFDETDYAEAEIYPVVLSHKWSAEHLYVLKVRGTSINKRACEGDLVLCLDIRGAPRSFAEGDWVIVERRDGGKVETTVKRVGKSLSGEWELWPDSDDPRFQRPISLISDVRTETIEVVAFVLDFIRVATKF